jgi:hypothetical protein
MMREQCAARPVRPRVVQEKTTLRNAKPVQIKFLYQILDNIKIPENLVIYFLRVK